MKWTLMLVATVAVIARADHAHACSCSMPQIEFSPNGADAPLNSTVVVWVPAYLSRGSEVNLSIRKKSSGDTIIVDYKKVGSASMTVLEMLPKAKLLANTEYEIVRLEGDVPGVVGSFATGAKELTAAPVWKGVKTAQYLKDTAVCCVCNTSDPYAMIELANPDGDEKSARQRRIGIWMSGNDGKIDYKKPPVTYEPFDQVFSLGHPSTCSPANFLFPKTKTLTLGFKLVDLAGNTSTASEVVLDTTKPTRPTEK